MSDLEKITEGLERLQLGLQRSQQRLDNIEYILNEDYANEKIKIQQNQKRLDYIEFLLGQDYENEKLKIRQNQKRLDFVEQQFQQMGNIEDTFDFLNKITNSQSGEDAIMAYVLANLKIPLNQCRYLDLGANDPIRGNNTYFFYTQGARGILVEANPQLIPKLEEKRPRDIVINKCIGNTNGNSLKFYIMSDDGLSTTELEEAQRIQKVRPDITLKETVDIPSITINEIFENFFEQIPEICSLDIEGKELDILRSINFEKNRPLLFVIEVIEYSKEIFTGKKNMELIDFMVSKGYCEYAFTGINSIFLDTTAIRN